MDFNKLATDIVKGLAEKALKQAVCGSSSSKNIRTAGPNSGCYYITDVCVACGTCASECPVNAINEGDIYIIDADECTACGTCAAVCPAEAIQI